MGDERWRRAAGRGSAEHRSRGGGERDDERWNDDDRRNARRDSERDRHSHSDRGDRDGQSNARHDGRHDRRHDRRHNNRDDGQGSRRHAHRHSDHRQEMTCDEKDDNTSTRASYGPDGRRLAPVERQPPDRPVPQVVTARPAAAHAPRFWSWDVDRVLFHRDAAVPKHSAAYYEFEEFFERFTVHERAGKLKVVENGVGETDGRGGRSGTVPPSTSGTSGISSTSVAPSGELARVQYVLALYHQFSERKRQSAVQRIAKERRTLPVSRFEREIVQTVQSNPVTIIAADTGAGKSTQVPQYLLDAGFQRIACTQPRRIACIALAKRVAQETGNAYGAQIAYQVRFDGTQTAQTRILFLTEGLLLRQFSGDPQLSRYDVIIVDEVHERHALGDFLLGVLKQVLADRPSLKLVLMSATINAELFSRYFDGAPLIQVPGKLYPVDIEYIPVGEPDRQLVDPRLHRERQALPFPQSIPTQPQFPDAKPYVQLLERIDRTVPQTERGDLLVFVSGINEITALAEELDVYARQTRRWIVLKLHSSLSIAEQDRVFGVAPEGVRKCILSTNIAETSVTIDGIRFIIDSGRVKELDFDLDSNLSRLSEFWIAKASAKQRMGRAGRTGPGQCFRLYAKNFAVPEIMRGPLASIVLQIKALNLGDPLTFDFIERPPPSHLQHAIHHLRSLGALADDGTITQLGFTLSHLPVDAIIGKMLVLAAAFDVTPPILIMAAGFSAQNSAFLRLSPEAENLVQQRRAEYISEHGDPFTLWNIYSAWLQVKRDRTQNSRKWCRQIGVEEQRLYEMTKLVDQFQSILDIHLADRSGEQEDLMDLADDENRPLKKRRRRRNAEAYARLQRFRGQQMEADGRGKQLKTTEEMEMLAAGAASDEEDHGGVGGNDDIGEDLHALEFDTRQDMAALEEQWAQFRPGAMSPNQIVILKLILCSGLYPNIAFPDGANYGRKQSEQMYHTRKKRFVLIHPTSVFVASSIDLGGESQTVAFVESANEYVANAAAGDLDITSMADITAAPTNITSSTDSPAIAASSASNSVVISRIPEFLCYLQLMETFKPYLMNLFRVPALHACLLFGRRIDTNASGTMLVVDDWIMIDFKSAERPAGLGGANEPETEDAVKQRVSDAAMRVLAAVVRLRRQWAQLVLARLSTSRNLKRGLNDAVTWNNRVSSDVLASMHPTMREIYAAEQRKGVHSYDAIAEQDIRPKFIEELVRFLAIDGTLVMAGVRYGVDTLREADLDVLFPGCEAQPVFDSVIDGATPTAARVKNGIQVTPYLRYASVEYGKAESSADTINVGERKTARRVWECPRCHRAWMVTDDEKAEHLSADCRSSSASAAAATASHTKSAFLQPAAGAKSFDCETCGQTLMLAPIEILRHKRSCKVLDSRNAQ